jgi:hypothetical protein
MPLDLTQVEVKEFLVLLFGKINDNDPKLHSCLPAERLKAYGPPRAKPVVPE